jgi:hypothetical protein
MKKWKYNPACVKDEVSINDMLSEEIDIISGDEMNLENEGQSGSEESSNTSSESECESETTVVCIDGWEDKKPNAYTFTKKCMATISPSTRCRAHGLFWFIFQ